MSRKTLTEILGLTGASALLYKLGEWTGKALHDWIAYELPFRYFGNYSWYNYEQYVRTYQHYFNNLDNLFGIVFGLTYVGLFLASYLYIRFSVRKWDY